MGWTYFHDYTRADVIQHLRRSLQCGGQVVRRSSAVGNNFWALLAMPDGRLTIAHAIIRGGTRKDPGWGYKDLSHRDGNDCPVDYLRFLPDTEDYKELDWREAVREHHRKKVAMRNQKKSLEPGAELTLAGKRYQLQENLGSSGWRVLCLDDGMAYRMPVKHVTQALRNMTS
ncbi:hypothetical protein [Burkholderia ubonensis]|uniref:hypothetical protein n=1 Tax=Burkholderia ubonensis TaxID=101571 RepID=UPI00076D0C5D|nr:hypothetical protein [Burkholderia ubonensis]KVP17285.1 hypothetical protein WJ84_03380 [Burkholderia ubonensis]